MVLAPYNVTQGGFTGGLVNAITKNGTNTLAATGVLHLPQPGLSPRGVRSSLTRSSASSSIGGSIGGPIIKDKLHFFVAGELNRATKPAVRPLSRPVAEHRPGAARSTRPPFTPLHHCAQPATAFRAAVGRADQRPEPDHQPGRAASTTTLNDNSRLVLREIYDNAKGDDFSR